MTARAFSTYLEDTILELKVDATNASVGLPADIAFGFTDQRHKLVFGTDDVPAWMEQLTEIKALCGILYAAKINSIAGFRRVAVSTNDLFVTTTDQFTAYMVDNSLETITPYKIEFRSFTPQLAAVMEGLAHSSNCYVVKCIVVKPAEAALQAQVQTAATPAPPPVAAPAVPPKPAAWGGRAAAGRQRGIRSQTARLGRAPPPPTPVPPPRPVAAPPAVAVAAPSGTTGLPTVEQEKLLYITLSVDVVRLK